MLKILKFEVKFKFSYQNNMMVWMANLMFSHIRTCKPACVSMQTLNPTSHTHSDCGIDVKIFHQIDMAAHAYPGV